jgi:hypothetical protein
MIPLREYWIELRALSGPQVIAKGRIQTIKESSETLVHVREVLPGTVTISREEFRAACQKQYIAMTPMRDLENELFGNLTD